MTPDAEQEFIALWTQGLTHEAMAQRLGCPVGTIKSRLHTLLQQGKIQRRRQRASSRQQGQARASSTGRPSTVHRPPSTVDPVPSTVHPLQADLTAALTTALQPVLARLDVLETGLARRPPDDRPPLHRPPSTVHPDTWELKQLKHSIRWTVYVPQAMKEELQRRAAARGENPSLLVQEALARWLDSQEDQ
jgi:predicted ArsR family transcriptional regulator